MLGELHAEGTSLLLTTHQLDEAQQVAQRIVIIDRGRVIAAGTFDELLSQTVGRRRRVVARFADDTVEERSIEDVAGELPGVLAELSNGRAEIVDLKIDVPTLQAVFLHLTGRELRE